jgi:hypothetical protein
MDLSLTHWPTSGSGSLQWLRPLVEALGANRAGPTDPQRCRWCRGKVIVLAAGRRHCPERSCVVEPLATAVPDLSAALPHWQPARRRQLAMRRGRRTA